MSGRGLGSGGTALPALRLALLATLVLGAVAVGVAALVGGSPAALGMLLGLGLVVGFFGFGAAMTGVVAAHAPRASLVVALLTYTLQVLLLAVVLIELDDSRLLQGAVERRWLAAGVILGTGAWIVALVKGSWVSDKNHISDEASARAADPR